MVLQFSLNTSKYKHTKIYDCGLTICILLVVSALIGMASIKIYGPDNFIEEAAEEVIKVQTGKDVDLSPDKS